MASLTAQQTIVCDQDGIEFLTFGQPYTVLEDETLERRWRIIRVTCDDGVARKVPPQYFRTTDGKIIGCRECFDLGIIRMGEDRGAYIKKCPTCSDRTYV